MDILIPRSQKIVRAKEILEMENGEIRKREKAQKYRKGGKNRFTYRCSVSVTLIPSTSLFCMKISLVLPHLVLHANSASGNVSYNASCNDQMCVRAQMPARLCEWYSRGFCRIGATRLFVMMIPSPSPTSFLSGSFIQHPKWEKVLFPFTKHE